jgi:tetratricopeptide (TPR) repeat protein
MKKIIISTLILVFTFTGYAGDKEYMKAMEQNIKELAKAKTASDYQGLANNFERIAEASPEKWIPLYYATYSYIHMVFAEGNDSDIDMLLDKAEHYLGKARELSPENDELEVLQGWIHQGRIQVDPMGRGQMYSEKASSSFGKAKNINPENPRVDYLVGLNTMYTPEMFGGGLEAACPFFKAAEEKFSSFEPETPISPDWGREHNFEMVKKCK